MTKIILDGLLLSVIVSLLLTGAMWINPRIFLHDYPKEIQAAAPPKTPAEKRLSLWIGIPFLAILILVPFFSTLQLKQHSVSFLALFANAFGVAFFFNLVDWLILDWLLFCAVTPNFIVIPGTRGNPAYKDYAFHFRGFLIGTAFSTILGLVIAGVVYLIG